MAWICGQCKNLIDNHLSTCSQCGSPRSPTAFGGVGEAGHDPIPESEYRDLAMEGHLKALSLWYRIGAGIGAAFGLFGIIAWSGHSDSARASAINTALVGLCAIVLLVCAGIFVLGHFLGRFANVARIIAGVFASLGMASQLFNTCAGTFAGRGPNVGVLFAGVFGLAWSSAVLWALFNSRSSEICTPRYRELIARTPDMKPRTFQSPFFWVPLILLGLGVGCGILGAASLMAMRSHY